MMLTTNAFPTVTPIPFFNTLSDVAGLYRNLMQESTQQLLLSSSRVVQEQTLRAFVVASQSCADALAKNALSVQQQSMGRLLDTHQKAMGMVGQAMGRAFMQAWMAGMQPAK